MKYLKILLPIIIITGLAGGYLFYNAQASKVAYNDPNTIGNQSGNLNNGGLFCEFDNKIYFSNPKDNGYLYQMDLNAENYKRISEDRVAYINAAGPYIYYTRKSSNDISNKFQVFNFNIVGIYRIKQKGKGIKQLYRDENGIMSLSGNYIYYQYYNSSTGIELHRVKIDGKEHDTVIKEDISPAAFYNNTLIYAGGAQDHNIHKMNLDTKSNTVIYEGNAYNVTINNGSLYFIDMENNYGIARIDMDGYNLLELVTEPCSTFNVSLDGRYLYYQTDKGDTNRLCRMDLTTLESETIMTGNYTNINVTSNHIFFEEFKTKKTYIMPNNDISLKEFNPPVLKK